jgi:hypothetical protein
LTATTHRFCRFTATGPPLIPTQSVKFTPMTATRKAPHKPAKKASISKPEGAGTTESPVMYVIYVAGTAKRGEITKIKRTLSGPMRVETLERNTSTLRRKSSTRNPRLSAYRKAIDALFEATPEELKRVMKLRSAGL